MWIAGNHSWFASLACRFLFPETFGVAKESKGLVTEDTQRETDKNWCKSGKALKVCYLSNGRGGSAKGFILRNPLQDKAFNIDGNTIRSWIMPKIVEKLGFLMRGMVEVRPKTIISRQNSFFATILAKKTSR